MESDIDTNDTITQFNNSSWIYHMIPPSQFFGHVLPKDLTNEMIWRLIETWKPRKGDRQTKMSRAIRQDFHAYMSWAIPSMEAITEIVQFLDNDCVLEICAGSGLWARLLRDASVRILPTDSGAVATYHQYIEVEKINARDAIAKYDKVCNALMSCWSGIEMPEGFTGKKYIYIGEDPGKSAHGFPDPKIWNVTRTILIPNCLDGNDYLMLCDRKNPI